jgi:hypothetical protein
MDSSGSRKLPVACSNGLVNDPSVSILRGEILD